ncbi:hypothetical protein CRUP_013486 [Coryphaenoides rupestris]|nr:hypothetical protein CRUP_013486 [Coryphaenoides rupestris]
MRGKKVESKPKVTPFYLRHTTSRNPSLSLPSLSPSLPPSLSLSLSVSQDDVVEDSMVVDARHHRHFVCRRGQVLRELAEEYGGVAVSFPRTGAHGQRVTLKGAKDCVEAAKRRIQEIVDDLENGEASPDGEVVAPPLPRKCDIITISGRAEKCELAKAALLALVPVTEDVEVSYELHRYIIGQKGSGIRKMMEEYEVNIWVPQPDQQWDVIRVTGQVTNVERAKQGLLERVRELQAEQEDRFLLTFTCLS